MPNKNYVKGRRKEYQIRKELLGYGFDIVQRTAGSHSPIDIIAINKKTKQILLIQAKPKYQHTDKLYKENEWLNDEFLVNFEVW